MEREKIGKEENWFGDLNEESVEKSSEIPPQIGLPEPEDNPLIVQILSEPKEIELKARKGTMFVSDVERIEPSPLLKGTLILPKSLRFNMAKAIKRNNQDYTKFNLVSSKWRIYSVMDDGNKYYHAEIIPSE